MSKSEKGKEKGGLSRRTWMKGVASGAAATALTPLMAQHEVRPVHDFSKGMYVVKDAGPGTVLETDKFKVTASHTPHLAAFHMRSLGYRIETEYGTVAISGDTAPSQAMVELGKGVDILIHECVVPDTGMVKDGKFTLRKGIRRLETDTENPGTGHTSPSELGRLAQQAGVKTLVPTHLPPYSSVPASIEMSRIYYGSRPEPGIWAEWVHAIKKEFSGRVVLAEDAMVLKVGD